MQHQAARHEAGSEAQTDNDQSRCRVAVLGLGKIARTRFLPVAACVESVEVTALGTRSPASTSPSKLSAPADVRVLTYADVIAAGREIADAVYIALPNDMHEEWTVRAAEAGLHVLSEKPLAGTRGAAERCRDACRDHGVALVEGFAYRHDPRHARVVELVKQGTIGNVHLVKSTICYFQEDLNNIRLSPERLGGALMDVGCYGIDLSRFVLGEEPVDVTASAVRGSRSGVDEVIAVVMSFASGALGVTTASTHLARQNSYCIHGTAGFIDVPLAFTGKGEGSREIIIRHGSGEQTVEEYPKANTFETQLRHFVRCIHAAPARAIYPAEDGYLNACVVERAAAGVSEYVRTDLIGTAPT